MYTERLRGDMPRLAQGEEGSRGADTIRIAMFELSVVLITFQQSFGQFFTPSRLN